MKEAGIIISVKSIRLIVLHSVLALFKFIVISLLLCCSVFCIENDVNRVNKCLKFIYCNGVV